MVVAIMLVAVGLVGCSSKIIVPPITGDAAGLRYAGKFVWFDLHTDNLITATRFYDAVFNWSFERTDDTSPKIKTILFQDKRIGNVVERKSKEGTAQWLSYLSVPDVDRTYEAALSAGATRLQAPQDMPDRGRVAVVLGPNKAPFAMVSSSAGDPPDVKPTDGYWLGAELWTYDVTNSIGFYTQLVGYSVRELDVHEKIKYKQLMTQGKPRAGVVSIPWEGVTPQWVPYVAVKSIEETVAKVEANGGRVLIQPDLSVKSGRVAIFKDPTGGVIAAQEFIPEEF